MILKWWACVVFENRNYHQKRQISKHLSLIFFYFQSKLALIHNCDSHLPLLLPKLYSPTSFRWHDCDGSLTLPYEHISYWICVHCPPSLMKRFSPTIIPHTWQWRASLPHSWFQMVFYKTYNFSVQNNAMSILNLFNPDTWGACSTGRPSFFRSLPNSLTPW